MPDRMPALFIGHGNPMNALQSNAFSRAWAAIGTRLPRPRAIVCISAHWYVAETAVTAAASPRTIHDFSGFPGELYEIAYPAPGAPELARRIRELAAPIGVRADPERGLDHGAWSVLCRMFPRADVPVIQLGMDRTQPPEFHHQLGKCLSPLREEGVLIVGSGNVVHNLRAYNWGRPDAAPADWAGRFETRVRDLLQQADHGALVAYEGLGPDARSAVPSPDHYLPLIYVLSLMKAGEPVGFPVEGFDGGSVSMLAVQIG
jgi:4,5-DOPA dioxygenase extradiol